MRARDDPSTGMVNKSVLDGILQEKISKPRKLWSEVSETSFPDRCERGNPDHHRPCGLDSELHEICSHNRLGYLFRLRSQLGISVNRLL